jgi:four helix bundle protein
MTTFKRFEDIKAWQKARILTQKVYRITAEGSFSSDYSLRDQIRRASVSIMANIAEGFGRFSEKEFANFLNIARGSTTEVQSHLYVALDLNFVSTEQFGELYTLLDEIARMLFNLRKHLKGEEKV